MKHKDVKFLKVLSLLLVIMLALVACSGGGAASDSDAGGASDSSGDAMASDDSSTSDSSDSSDAASADSMDAGGQKYAPPGEYNEVPFLADRVASGELPPIDERLPVNPFVVGPGVLNSEQWLDFEAGNYGGTIRVPSLNGTSHEILLALGMTILRAPDQSTKDPLPAIVSSYEINDDFTEYTLTIREGLKWSDGHPLTTEDVRMTWELYQDERIYPSPPIKVKTQGRGDGNIGELTIMDDFTFKITFDAPYGQFLAELASWIPDYTLLFRPAHFIQQFHIDYTDIADIQPILDEQEIETWEQLVQLKDMPHWELHREHGIGVPSLAPWIAEEVTTAKTTLVRNPYYWKVDIAGNQLPYVDKVEAEVSNDLQAIILKAAAGEYDVVTSYAQLKEMPLYRENAERSNISTVLHGSINNPPILFLNHDFDYESEGSVWQSLVSDPRFGSALAYAIDKEDVNQNLYFGLYSLDGLTKETFDPDQSNALLDEIGMTERDADGFRLDPNGDSFELIITTAEISPDFLGLGELLKVYFENVGVRTTFDVVGNQLFGERRRANELMATIHWSDEPIWAPGISEDYCPRCKGSWAPMSQTYFLTNGESGRQPPAYLQEYFDIHTARKLVPPQTPEGEALYAELEEWFANHYATIWPVGRMTVPTVYNSDLGNVIKEGYPHDRALDYGMEQLFYRTPQ
ncbi:MAG: ABC transporter substrate-binding protein [Chloroflexota bacterium]